MDPADLERLIDLELRTLPSPHAPPTLLPRVLASVDARAYRPWYMREWLAWPLGWQAASVTAAMVLLAAIVMVLPAVTAGVAQSHIVTGVTGAVAAAAQPVQAVADAARVVWRAVLAPVVPYAFGLVLLMCMACAVFGTALNHLVFGRALR